MATFAPNLPDTEGNATEYLGLSKPITQPEGDKSFAFLGEGAGKVLAGAGKISKNIYDEQAKSNTAAGAQELIGGEIAGLETVRDSLLQQPDKAAEVTAETANRASTILEAQKANGALTATHFDAVMIKYMKDQRAKYPFAVDAVDKGIKEATGHLYTANEYANKLREQINSFITAKDRNADKVISHLLSLKEPEAATVAAAMMKDPGNPEHFNKGIAIINAHNTFYGAVEERKARLEDRKLTDEDKQRIARHDVEDAITTEINKFNKGVLPGLTGITTPEQERQAILDHATGVKRLDQGEVRERVQLYQGYVENYLMPKLNKLLTEPGKDTAGNPLPNSSYAYRLGSVQTNAILTNAREQALINQKYLENQHYGPLFTTTNQLSDIHNSDKLKIRASELGLKARLYDVAREMSPSLMNEAENTIAGDKENSPTKVIKSYINALNARSFTPYNRLPDVENKPPVPGNTMSDDAKDLRKQTGNALNLEKLAEANKFIADPKTTDESARARIDYAFDEKVHDFLSNFQKPNQPRISEKLVNKDILKRAHDLGGSSWDKVSNFTDVMVGRMLTPDVLALNGLQKTENDLIAYDDKTHEFKYIEHPLSPSKQALGGPRGAPREMSLQEKRVNDSIAPMNRALRHIVDKAEVEGKDPNQAIYNTLRLHGYDEVNAPKGFNKAMVEAMRAAALQRELGDLTTTFESKKKEGRKLKREFLQ
jgi:hypothetical protein